MNTKSKPIAIVVITLALSALLFGGNPGSDVSAQKKQTVQSAAIDGLLDSGSHPCVGSRLYYLLDFGPNAGMKSRLFVPAAVHDHQVVDGHLFLAPEDVVGTQYEGKLLIFLSGIHGGGVGELGTWHWSTPQCYLGD